MLIVTLYQVKWVVNCKPSYKFSLLKSNSKELKTFKNSLNNI